MAREQHTIVLLGLSVAGVAGMPISAWIIHEFGVGSLYLGIGAPWR